MRCRRLNAQVTLQLGLLVFSCGHAPLPASLPAALSKELQYAVRVQNSVTNHSACILFFRGKPSLLGSLVYRLGMMILAAAMNLEALRGIGDTVGRVCAAIGMPWPTS
jgi:hypothetical protein